MAQAETVPILRSDVNGVLRIIAQQRKFHSDRTNEVLRDDPAWSFHKDHIDQLDGLKARLKEAL